VLRERTGIAADVKPGEKSQFDVLLDGRLVFSKQAEGRFPEEDEILQLVA
jgi:selT/selW/selH-like putative selenoprotein